MHSSSKDHLPYSGISYLEYLAPLEGVRFCPIEIPRRILYRLGNPQDRVRSIHVGGTNGKGSVCAMLASIAWSAGNNVGQFASPHLSHVTERCLINGVPAEVPVFDEAVAKVRAVCEQEGLTPSYFVAGAVASFIEFARRKLDWMVIEVGLGGLYDATNIIRKPEASVITTIGYDHMHILGNTLEEIARSKAGIFRPGVPAFVGRVTPAVRDVLRNLAEAAATTVECMDEDYSFDPVSGVLHCSDGSFSLAQFAEANTAPYQLHNAVLAARTAAGLGFSEKQIQEGLRNFHWPGRVEELELGKTTLVLDAAHNPEGVLALISFLENWLAKREQCRQVIIVLSILGRKNWKEMLNLLVRFGDSISATRRVSWIISRIDEFHRVDVEGLASMLPHAQVSESPQQAIERAREDAADNALIVVTGSIYFLGMVRPLLVPEGFFSLARGEAPGSPTSSRLG